MKKNILIIAYKFPPMGGIGTRRWAKFAKYLANIGYTVHILTIKYSKAEEINWYHDIKDNDNIIVHRINSGYPKFLMNISSNKYIAFLQKSINYILKRTFFYIDIAQNWAKYMLPEAKKIINDNNIENVIVTSPPHSIAYYATYLKVDLPHINLIQDFRDNWNDDKPYEYPNTLKLFWQKEKSAYMEWFVVNHSDKIVNVTQDITNRTKNKFTQYNDKFLTIYNGYDKDDIKGIDLNNIQNEGKIKIIYAGGLGLGRIEAIELIMDVLLNFSNEKLNQFELNIYTSFDKSKLGKKYNSLFEKKIVNFFGLVPPKEIFNIINMHEYCLSINAPIYPFAFGTKIFDYMMLNKRIIHISNGGELSNILIEENQIAVSYSYEEILRVFQNLKYNVKSSENKYQDYDIANLVEKYKFLLS
jgi:glycosyltransferase involved in cell wall biosynthesis